MKPILRSTLRSTILTTSILSCLAGAARAATFNWNVGGATDNWNTSDANWTGTGSTWVNGANQAVFGGTDGEAITVDASGVTANQLQFNNTGTAYSLSGGTITINGGIPSNKSIDATANATISSNISISGAQTYFVSAGKTLNLGSINAAAAGTNWGLQGGGSIIINGSIGGNVKDVLFNDTVTNGTVVTFTQANTFTGLLRLGDQTKASTLNFSNVNQLGSGTNGTYISIQRGSTLNFTGTGNQSKTNRQIFWNVGDATIGVTDANANLTLGSTSGAVRSQNFTKIGAGTLTLDPTATITGGSLTVNGGTLVLQAANTSTGATTIKNGTLLLSGGDNRLASGTTVTIGDTSTTGKLVLGDGIAKSDLSIAGLSTTGLGGSVTGGNGSVSALTVNTASSNAFAGVLGGGGTHENNLSLTKSGAGTLTLSGASTFTGPTTISAGRLNVTGSLSASDVSLNGGSIGGEGSVKSVTFNGGALAVDAQTAGSLSVSSSLTSMGNVPITFTTAPSAPGSIALIHHAGDFTGSLNDFSLSSAIITRSSTITDVAGTITLDIGSANRTWSGTEDTWKAASGTAWIEGDQAFYDYDFVSFPDPVGPKTVTLGEVLFPSSTIVTNTTGNDYTFSGTGSLAGQGTLTKNGTGTLLISTATTYTGLTTVNNGTLIVAPHYNATGNITILGGSALVNSGATLKFDFTNVTNGSAYPIVLLNGGGTTTLNAGSTLELYADGPAHAMNNTAILFAANGATLIGAGTVKKTGSGAIDFFNAGPGAGFTGAFDVQDGVLTFQRTLADYSGKSPMHIELNATVDVRGGGLLAMVDTLTGTGIVSSSANAGNILSVGNNGGSATFDGVITDGANVGTRNGKAGTWSGTLALVKNGAGTQTLTAANGYSGTTTVANGTLLLNNTTGSGTGTGGVIVQSGGTLGGTGSISGTVSAAGALAPGSSGTGTLTTGAITLTGTYQCQLDGPNCDQLAITGALTVGSGAAITISSLATPSAASYTILSYGSLSGTLPAITPPSGYQVVHDTTAKQLKLVKSSGYSSWAATNAPTGTPSDDYDGDGVSNALEWILGGLASTNDQSKLPSVSTSGGNLVFSFVRNDAAWQSGDTSTQIQVGTNLATWPNVYNVGIDTAASSAGVTVTDNGSTDTVTLTVSIGADTKKFARLKATVTTTP